MGSRRLARLVAGGSRRRREGAHMRRASGAASARRYLYRRADAAPLNGLHPYKPLLLQILEDEHGRLLRRGAGGVDGQLGLERRLVGVVDAGEVLQLPGASLLVQ